MPTTVHIPQALLDAVDRRARQLKISRNRLIVRALQDEIERRTTWSPEFFDELARVQPGDADAVEQMLAVIRAGRASKGPRRL
jgi:metal-responsive CopG/Arc/MetJ family transcriptional regulator